MKWRIAAGGIFLMLLAACQGSTTNSAPLVETETAPLIRPSPSPTYTGDQGTILAEQDDLAGIWFSLKTGVYWLFTSEGFFAASMERSDIQGGAGLNGGFWFEDDTLYMEHYQVYSEEVEQFVGSTNSFTVRRFPDGTLRFYKVDVEWEFLANVLAGEGGVAVYYYLVG